MAAPADGLIAAHRRFDWLEARWADRGARPSVGPCGSGGGEGGPLAFESRPAEGRAPRPPQRAAIVGSGRWGLVGGETAASLSCRASTTAQG